VFVSKKAAFEDYKNYADQELGKTPDTERRFYQRLRDTPKITIMGTFLDVQLLLYNYLILLVGRRLEF
jgi:hypothetical protein